jgi:coatomer protein complex subunit gamma
LDSFFEISADILRDEGGFEYKKAIVESILAIITQIPESKEAGVYCCICYFIFSLMQLLFNMH